MLKKLGKALICVILSPLAAPLAHAEWVGNVDLGIRHDSNINNAQLGSDIASDSVSSADLLATDFFALEDGNSVSITGQSKGEVFHHYTGLNNVALGAALGFRKKWALGPYAPWSGLSLSSQRINFTDASRNGWRNQVAISCGQRLFERWDVGAEYMLERRTAAPLAADQPGISGDVFSQTSRSMTLNAEYAWSERLFLTLGSLWRRGDVVSSARETSKIISSSQAIAADQVFGPDFYAYKMRGTTYGLDVDMTIAFTSRNLLRASISRQVTHAGGDNDYAKTVAMLSWTYHF